MTTLKNIARGHKPYRYMRRKIARIILETRGKAVADLTSYHFAQLFDLDKSDWAALSFEEKDWQIVERLASGSGAIDDAYVELITEYIKVNKSRVNCLYQISAQISLQLINDDSDALDKTVADVPPDESQSLFVFRSVSAMFRSSSEKATDILSRRLMSAWARQRFLYPLVYFAMNAPTESYMDMFLSYVVTGYEDKYEKDALKFLLKDDACVDMSFTTKAYVALSCHPFDACEMLLNHAELEAAHKGRIPDSIANALDILAETIDSPRLKSLRRILSGGGDDERSVIEHLNSFGFGEAYSGLVAQICQTNSPKYLLYGDEPNHMKWLLDSRTNQYPNPADYNSLFGTWNSWHFTDLGRMLRAILFALYFYPRGDSITERREVLRLLSYIGEANAFIASAPNGRKALAQIHSAFESVTDVELMFDDSWENFDRNSRMEINAIQWLGEKFQRRGHIRKWLSHLHKSLNVHPEYLSGVDWAWVDNVIDKGGIEPFRNDADGVFALLLRYVESLGKDDGSLRLAIESFSRGKTLGEFVEWIIDTYKTNAPIFIVEFLTPSNLMLLRMAPNYTAALDARVEALEICMDRLGDTEFLPKSKFKQESESLTKTLLWRKIDNGQFDIPWEMFESIAEQKHRNLFDVSVALNDRAAADLLGESKRTWPQPFQNGQVVEYTALTKHMPLSLLILSIIDEFIQHPSFGLEMLLSTRFRHDLLRREIINHLTSLVARPIPPVPRGSIETFFEIYRSNLMEPLEEWIRSRLHSRKPDKPNGLFNLAPDKTEHARLIQDCLDDTDIRLIVGKVTCWLQEKLKAQLKRVQDVFEDDVMSLMKSALETSIAEAANDLRFRESDLNFLSKAIVSAATENLRMLKEWFSLSAGGVDQSLTFEQVVNAVTQRFEHEIDQNRLIFNLTDSDICQQGIPAEKVRLCYDLLSEIANNALKHSKLQCTEIAITPTSGQQFIEVLFANKTSPRDSSAQTEFVGIYNGIGEADLYGEKKSGFRKIASISATLVGANVKVLIEQKADEFSVAVPMWHKNVE